MNSLSLIRPSLSFSELHDLTNRVFEDTMTGRLSRRIPSYAELTVDHEEDAIVVSAEVPGVEPQDIKVKLEGRTVSVSTPSRSMSYTLGQRIKAEEATATLKRGLLKVRIPTRSAQTVEIQVVEE